MDYTRNIVQRLYESRLQESSVDIISGSKSYTLEYEVTRGKNITVAIPAIKGEEYFIIGNLIGSALSNEFYGIRRTPNADPGRRGEWIFNYTYTRRKSNK